ncbi:MAG TPA: CcdC protein domain-containing protein [Staphylococcus sp.]|nr:CcdC protein domain-containing protein [Staphylococcus sp.]
MLYLVFSIVFAFIMGLGAIFIRMKAQEFPVNERKIILPPFFMSTGALMYVVPYFRLSGLEIMECIIVGIAFSTILIWSSKFEVQGNDIYMKRSKAFPIILISLLLVRTLIKIFISNKIDPGEIGGMFFLLGFSMIVPWRLAMLYKYKKLKSTLVH